MGDSILDTESIVGRKVGSLSEEFDFPVTLFRRGMVPYFENMKRPKRDEFLMALMMEDVNGSTTREIAAIQAAQIYVEGKGDDTDSGSVKQGSVGDGFQGDLLIPRQPFEGPGRFMCNPS